MSDLAADANSEEGSIAGPSQAPSAKVSCLNCRAAKRKCHTSDEQSACRRCVAHHLKCEYKKHHRGRKRKAPSLSPSQAADVVASNVEGRSDVPQSEPIPLTGQARAPKVSVNIHFSHLVPVDGDSSPYIPRGMPTQSTRPTSLEQLLRSDCPDPVMAGVLSESDALDIFKFYFQNLNVTLTVLDPIIHTAERCRERSPLLFTAVLAVTSRVIRPKAYAYCLSLANKLVGQTMEHGLSSVEIVQALNLLTHWKKADDNTSWRRVGYAIRMAQELKLHERGPRPLPAEEFLARDIVNRERAWFNLVLADYHLAIHHTLPRMITDEGIDDPANWVNDHPQIPCPGESSIGPMITFSRMCRLYADTLEAMNGDISNLRLLSWVELEWKRWRSRWLVPSHNFLHQQMCTFKICDAYFRFHIAEARLLYLVRFRGESCSENGNAVYAFRECVESALAVAGVFQLEFVQYGYLPYCFNLVWVALAVTAVWLIKNVVLMELEDRTRATRILSEIQTSTEEASCNSDDMAAYAHRVLKHLLGGVPPEWQFKTTLNHPRPAQAAPIIGSTSPLGWNAVQPMDLWDSGASIFDVGNALLSLRAPADSVVPSEVPGDMLVPPVDDDFWKSLFPPTGSGLL